MISQGSNEDEAAILLGASGWQMFRRVTLPNIRWALLYGVVLTNARAIGEFGAVSVVSGSIRGETCRCRCRLNCWSRITIPSVPLPPQLC
jgi:sulfate transport system permease protein